MLLFSQLSIALSVFALGAFATEAGTQTEEQPTSFTDRSFSSKVSLTLRQELVENYGKSRQGIFVRFPKLAEPELQSQVNSHVFNAAERLFQEPSTSDAAAPNIRVLRRTAVNQVLRSHADIFQAPLRETLDALNVEYESLWIGNSIFIRNAPVELIELLAQDENVVAIDANENVAELLRPVESVEDVSASNDLKSPDDDSSEIPWNLAQINVDKAWTITKGEGVS